MMFSLVPLGWPALSQGVIVPVEHFQIQSVQPGLVVRFPIAFPISHGQKTHYYHPISQVQTLGGKEG